ncbi:MAG TPA: hypothetical protein VGQ91_11185 [Ideonella sp.]|nr:hypothetical protein [Ideonella sp.]
MHRKPKNDYRPTSRRQRRIIIAVTAATVVVLWLLLIYHPGGKPRVYPEPKRCAPGQTTGCVGGQADVMLIPASPASPAAPNASAPGH